MAHLDIFKVDIPQLRTKRTVRVLLPDDYDVNDSKCYPVLYMHDGQNLFDDSTATYGTSWGIKDSNKGRNFIIVGVDCSETRRLIEYSPWVNFQASLKFGKFKFFGGKGFEYAEFFANDLRNLINQKYRTLSDFDNTFIAGSSMGAFISLVIMARYPDIYSCVGCFSLASWAAEKNFLKLVYESELCNNERFFIYVGTDETSNEKYKSFQKLYLDCSDRFYRVLRDKDIKSHNIRYIIGDGKTHCEACWKEYVPAFLDFLENK